MQIQVRDSINRREFCKTASRTVQTHGRHLTNVLKKCVKIEKELFSEPRVCMKLCLISEEPVYELTVSSRELKDTVFLIENRYLLRQASIPS